jgi:phenylacetic acid degradation operon negative regulatory protein
MADTCPIKAFLAARMKQGHISSTSLLITLFCDAVSCHGGEIWLGSLIRVLAPLGLSERLVRTAVFRLVQDDWLTSRKEGRRSYYRLSDSGTVQYRRAARRIYSGARPEWDGSWTLLIPAAIAEEKRDALRKGLLWQGFGMLAPGVYARPTQDKASLHELLDELDIHESLVIMSSRAEGTASTKALQGRVSERWNLDDLGHQYEEFLSQYRPVLRKLRFQGAPGAESGFLLRTLLIHDYRRILLRDPGLPAAMLPADWAGFEAQELTAVIYGLIRTDSSVWFSKVMQDASGEMPRADAILFQRFGNAIEESGRHRTAVSA